MIILTVFTQQLQEMKRKAISKYNKNNKYINKNNENLPKFFFLKNLTYTKPCNLDNIKKEIIIIVG